MGMLGTVLANLRRPARTRPPGDQPSLPLNYRGALTHDPLRCTACGTCAFVCAPRAISLAVLDDHRIAWRYEVGRCSFCGLCERNCPTAAIGNTGTTVPVATERLVLESIVLAQTCTRCGQPYFPLPAELSFTNGSPVYCPACREWAASRTLRNAFSAGGPDA